MECVILEGQQTKGLKEKLSGDLIWILYVGRASYSQGSGINLILTNSGVVIEYTLRFTFKASNNQAEYETLLSSLKVAKELSVKRLKVFIDS